MTKLNDAFFIHLGSAPVHRIALGGTQVWKELEAPENLLAPAISGILAIGQTLTAAPGSWSENPTSYAYQWQQDIASTWTDIVGETNTTYVITEAGDFRAEVTAINVAGSTAANSNVLTVSAEPEFERIGTDTFGGAGNWPSAEDRAMANRYTMPENGVVDSISIRCNAATVAGCNVKVLIWAANGPSGQPGTLLGVSTALAFPAGGGYVTGSIPGSVALTSGTNYWIGFVCDSWQAEIDSSLSNCAAQGITNTIMFNGTVSYSSPAATAPTSADADYANALAVCMDYIPA